MEEASKVRARRLKDDPALRTPDLALDLIANPVEDIGFHPTNIRQPHGGTYAVNINRPCYTQLKAAGIEGRGRLSPAAMVSLTDEAKEAAKLPKGAAHFCFAYPLAFADGGGGGGGEDVILPSLLSDPRISLLALGGFVYWDAHWRVCGVAALKVGTALRFDLPKALSRLAGGAGDLLRSSLYDTDRIEQVTIQPMLDRGISGFCWLAPGEGFPGQDPSKAHPWPHGAFAYFFDDSTSGAAAEDYYCRVLGSTEEPSVGREASGRRRSTMVQAGQDGKIKVDWAVNRQQADVDPRANGCCARLARYFRHDQRYHDFVRKAECHCLLRRAVADVWTVRVKGNLDSLGGTAWSKRALGEAVAGQQQLL